MPIIVNAGGVLHELTEITSNNGGALYGIDTVHANGGGVLHEIYSAWEFPVLSEWHTIRITAKSFLNGDTYDISVHGSAASDFTLTGKTKVIINITHYSSSGTIYSNIAEIRNGKFIDTFTHYPTEWTYVRKVRTGQNDYTTFANPKAEYILEKGNYYVGCSSNYDSGSNSTIEFKLKFEKA